MSLALNAAPFVREEPITENIKKKLNSTENIKKKLRNKTEKKEVSFVLDENDDNDNDLVDFAPANEKPNKTSELVSEITENSNTDSFAYENIGFFSDNFNCLPETKLSIILLSLSVTTVPSIHGSYGETTTIFFSFVSQILFNNESSKTKSDSKSIESSCSRKSFAKKSE